HLGGRVSCEAVLGKFDSSYVNLFGTFNSSIEVSQWNDTSVGDSIGPVWSYATDFFTEGTGSVKKTFTKSDGNNYPEISYTFPSPLDLSGIVKVSADVRTSVSGGGGKDRAVQIRLHSGTASRIWQITGRTDQAPFNIEQWHYI